MEILLVEDDRHSREAVMWFLQEQGHKVTECDNAREALAKWRVGDYPLIISDIQMPGMSGLELANAINGQPDSWRTDVVLFTGYGDMKTAVAALRAGAYDYLLKPVDAEELATVIQRVAEHQALLRENRELTKNFDARLKSATMHTVQELTQMRKLVAETVMGKVGFFSPQMQAIKAMALRYNEDRTIPVLLQGETGTGKEVIARLIHYGSELDLAAAPLVELNCAAIPHNLFESELFGYEGGAFSGSLGQGKKGKLDAAAGGTLLLDEVAEMPTEIQAKLLRVVETKEYYRLGGLQKIKANVRIICATNVDLDKKMQEGSFRSDLYYRLKIGHLVIPPLRERQEDIVPLAAMFLREFSQTRKKCFSGINNEAQQLLQTYNWPGNVRELRNAIEWAVFMYNEEELQPCHLEKVVKGTLVPAGGRAAVATGERRIILPLPEAGLSIKAYNDLIVQAVLDAHHGNQTAAAKYLDMSLRAFCYRLEQMRGRQADDEASSKQ
ncbi:sigma-54-dependent transcriptional regulator [Sporomusa sphaeroides]|uniref:sigma-54-dependent transcriptional regulator n=1 Tax=Sporomusa sphaeroides TaxID=47679 RepID=UPI002C45DA97|nr:sigma-54 dependent transcriptional regulator [Sporomusa sphaeroides]HML32593.1 sigma-54 dependent transcriptional regulator [Sporomusa sphaeroides]